jgi:hypothetical protein
MDISKILQTSIDKVRNVLYTMSPGRVVKVNLVGQYIESVDVLPQVNKLYKDGKAVDRAVVYRVPIIFPASGSGILSFPIEIGDPVLLGFCSEDIQSYLNSGIAGTPSTSRKFSEVDAVAFPCLFPYSESPGADATNMVLRFNDSFFRITAGGEVQVYSESILHLITDDNLLLEVAGDLVETIEGDHTTNVTGNTTKTLEGTFNINAGGGFNFTRDGEELLSLLSDLCAQTAAITHPYTWTDPAGAGTTSAPSNAGSINSIKAKIEAMKS